jgi:cell division protein FtsZ
VVGTVIDPDMTDSLKVTVVATGLRNVEARPTLTTVEPAVAARPVTSGADYEDYDLPPAKRRQATTTVDGQAAVKLDEDLDEQLFDVPAFLRRQAD